MADLFVTGDWALSSAHGAVFAARQVLFGHTAGVWLGDTNFAVTGASLDIAPGTIIKSTNWGIRVQAGNSLTVRGTEAEPVVITSYSNDTIAGDTNGDADFTGPADFAYTAAISVGDDTTVTASHLHVSWAYGHGVDSLRSCCPPAEPVGTVTITDSSFDQVGHGIELVDVGIAELNVEDTQFTNVASTAVKTTLDAARFERVDIDGAHFGLEVPRGMVTYRGSILNVYKGVVACPSGGGCAVDASHTDWGPEGPFPASGTLACGSVRTLPWVGGPPSDQTIFEFVFACDETGPSIKDELDAAVAGANERIDNYCNGQDPAWCDAEYTAEMYRNCFNAAKQLAQDYASGAESGELAEVATMTLDHADEAITTLGGPSIASATRTVSVGMSILGALDTIDALIAAYNRCP